MLNWLRSLLGLGVSRDRVVFRYRLGTSRAVGVDPLRIKAALDDRMPDWRERCAKLAETEQVSAAGLALKGGLAKTLKAQRETITRDLIALARHAFALPPYEERDGRVSGATDLEALDVLASYLGWLADVMGDTRPLATAPPCTGSAAPDSPSASGSGSPSTPTASNESVSGPSPSPSVVPSGEAVSEGGTKVLLVMDEATGVPEGVWEFGERMRAQAPAG